MNRSLQLVLHLRTLRGDLTLDKYRDYNRNHIGVRLPLDTFTILQDLLEL
jgi:hypothetical protein